MTYKYFLYGLKVESEIEIEEAFLKDFDGAADVKVVVQPLPQELLEMYKDKTESDYFVAKSKAGLAFRVAGVADYLSTADVISVNPFEGAALQEVKAFLLGSGFGYCMILKQLVVMHGGGVSNYGKGVIITGESGAGKSTVTDGLLARGYKFIADDVCALSEDGDRIHINMAYPQQKLCRDAAVARGYNLDELIYINEERDKFALRLKDGYLADGMDFDYLFELVVAEDEELKIRQVTGQDKLMLLMRNIYRGEDGFNTWGVPPIYMKKCLNIASKIHIFQIARPKNLDTLPDILDFIDKCVQENK